MAAPVVRFRIDFAEHSSLGPGKICLLEAIRDAGSLSQGARNIGMSYRRAWLLVESLKQSFREPVTVASTGGKDGGGMQVTEFGDALIKNYRELERDFATLAQRRLHPITATVIRHSKSGARVSVRTKLE
jgi:molybdate transport system regulatory protein